MYFRIREPENHNPVLPKLIDLTVLLEAITERPTGGHAIMASRPFNLALSGKFLANEVYYVKVNKG